MIIVADSSKFSKKDSFILNFKKEKDSFFHINKGLIKIVGSEQGSNNFKALLISNLQNYFIEPVESMSGLGIVVGMIVSEGAELVTLADIKYKYFCILDANKFILVPILHNLFYSFS